MKNYSVFFALFLLFTGCSVGPDYEKPEIALPSVFTNISPVSSVRATFSLDEPEIKWWNTFQDQTLNNLIEIGRKENFTIKIAASRIKEARALKKESFLNFLPAIRNENSYRRSLFSTGRNPAFDIPRNVRDAELYTVGFDATWEIDVLGRVRRAYESNDAQVEAALANLDDALISIDSEIAKTYFEYVGYSSQAEIAENNAKNQDETFSLTKTLAQEGAVSEFDVARAESQVSTTRAQVPNFAFQRDAALQALTVLLNKSTDEVKALLKDKKPLPELKETIKIGSPETLIRNRPDVRSAENLLRSSNALIGVSQADYFPRITFNGSYALEALSFSKLDNGSPAESFSLGPSISWAFLDMGRVYAQNKAARAREEAARNTYKQTVLTALQETETALLRYNNLQKSVLELSRASIANEKANKIARERYTAGISDFLTVLDVERTSLNTDIQLAQSKTDAAVSVIAVYKALGRGAFKIDEISDEEKK